MYHCKGEKKERTFLLVKSFLGTGTSKSGDNDLNPLERPEQQESRSIKNVAPRVKAPLKNIRKKATPVAKEPDVVIEADESDESPPEVDTAVTEP